MITYILFTNEGFFEVAVEVDLSGIIYMYIYIYILRYHQHWLALDRIHNHSLVNLNQYVRIYLDEIEKESFCQSIL